MNDVYIQVQDSLGNWTTYSITVNDSQMIRARMKELTSQFPNHRIRAIDKNGRVVDIL